MAFALVKGDRPELVVQKLTELGVDRIIPFRAARSVVRWDDARAAKAVERLRAVARAAAQQCHRPWLPEVDRDRRLLRRWCAATASRSPTGRARRRASAQPVRAGRPEGGWAPEERAAAAEVGAPSVAIGAHVLRAETAAVTVGAILTGLRSGLLGEISSP